STADRCRCNNPPVSGSRLTSAQRTNAVRFAVAHVQDASSVVQDAVWSRERAPERIRFGAVAALTCAERRSNHTCLQIDRTDDVALGVGDVERVAPPRESLRPGKPCEASLTTVARVPLLAGSGDVMPGHLPAVETVDRVPFP